MINKVVKNRSEKGATALEFAILCGPFFLIVFFYVSLLIVCFRYAGLVITSYEIAREIQLSSDSGTAGALPFITQLQTIARKWGVKVLTNNIQLCVPTAPASPIAAGGSTFSCPPLPTDPDIGIPGDFVRTEVSSNEELLFVMPIKIKFSHVVRREPAT